MSEVTSENATSAVDSVALEAAPSRVHGGGVVLLRAEPPYPGTYDVHWMVDGPVSPPDHPSIVLHGTTTVEGNRLTYTAGNPVRATLDTSGFVPGAWTVRARFTRVDGEGSEVGGSGDSYGETDIEVLHRPFTAGDDVAVTLRRAGAEATPDQGLWVAIRSGTTALGFENYRRFLGEVLGDGLFGQDRRGARRRDDTRERHALQRVKGFPFASVNPYQVLQVSTAVFMMLHCGVDPRHLDLDLDLDAERRRLDRPVQPGQLEDEYRRYLVQLPASDGHLEVLPYLALIRMKLGDVAVASGDREHEAQILDGILRDKLARPCFLELIWSYWMECAGLPQAMNAILWRFQNRSVGPAGRDPLAGLDIDPLRPLNHLIWGELQNAQAGHLLTTARRVDEYQHEYGLGPGRRPGSRNRYADPRSQFVEAFHNLLALCADFYWDDDNTTIIADAFGLLNGLREVHLLLSEGSGNAYGELPWTARHGMLIQQYILGRPEMREFLPTRTMIAYPEDWMGPLEAMNRLQGWSESSVLHFRDLAVFGEQLLLGIRFGDWTQVNESERAANWARYWRSEVKAYCHAHRAVTGTDVMHHGQQGRRSMNGRSRAYRA